MASAIYPLFKQALLSPGVDLSTANVKVALIDVADYTYSATHDFYDDVATAAKVATTPNLTGKTFTNGVFDANDTVFTGVTGDPSEALIVYIDTGTAATSRLMVYIDTVAGPAALTVTPNSGDINVTWAAGGIFAL